MSIEGATCGIAFSFSAVAAYRRPKQFACSQRLASVHVDLRSPNCFLSRPGSRYVEDLPAGQSGWLAGLRDPVVARALALMHGDMARDLRPIWSVDGLGRESGLSARPCRPFHAPDRIGADALPDPLAHASGGTEAERHQRFPGANRRGDRL